MAARWFAAPGWHLPAWGLALLVGLAGVGFGQARQATESEVKAAYLYNFTKFIEWPAQAFGAKDAPAVLGVVGENPFGDTLSATLRNERVKDRPVEIRYLQPGDDLSRCHVVFISRAEANRTRELLASIKGRPVLTVSDQEDFVERGGMIALVRVGENIRFDIGLPALEEARLKASSKLLSVARSVVKHL